MKGRKTTYTETEYNSREIEPMEAVRRIMLERGTGQMVLNMSQGRIFSVVWKEKVTEVAGVNGNLKMCLTSTSP